ncbi:hypothetical protein H6G97_20885 [Nostoc flagelliforme FACHB-838]|uniref:Peptidase n=1 Tax=Nostoc flagelliforme FACHB-838 TaxID=2692904 RepID=A0ABR8DR69_9NOSO|nr:hypothetical protein [Nostoc flagelliforme]MBD2531906.1 hypothetical protein [Nostoc flagelliforme FACHB-838]
MINFKNILLTTSTTIISLPLLVSPRAIADSQTPTITYSSGKYQVQAPDWSRITWSNLPPVQQPGYLSIPKSLVPKFGYDPGRSWSAGQKVDSIVMLGDVEDAFQTSSLSLKTISAIVPLDSNLTLKDLGLMQWQTPSSLVKAIPGLGNLNVSQVKPIRDLFAKEGIRLLAEVGERGRGKGERNGISPYPLTFDLSPTSCKSNFCKMSIVYGGTISQILEYNPQAGKLPLSRLNLGQYSLDSIPGLTRTEISKFQSWQQSFINQVPGLNQVPFDQMPQPINAGTGVVGVASLVLGKAEHGDNRANSNYFLTGTVDRSSQTVPVACEASKECAYMELGDLAGQSGSLYGKRWASGSSQQVKGGFGILGSVNGGQEPTGRLVYGSGFKVVLTGVNESTGTADFGLFLRICANIPFVGKTCTPYFIGPVPWIPVRENNLVIVGTGQ